MSLFLLQEFNGHRFSTTQFSIPTFCEQCGGFIWGLDKGFVCQGTTPTFLILMIVSDLSLKALPNISSL